MRGLIQVLVAVVVALLTAGLLLTGVAAVRDAAGRLQCTNNLKQLGISLRNYHDTNKGFPPAGMPNPDVSPEHRLSWIVAIVPFVEADNLFARMKEKEGWDAERNRFAALIKMHYLRCPGFPEEPPTSTLEPTHYLGIAGLGTDAAALPAGDAMAGFFGYDRTVRSADLGDHASSLLVVETARVTGSWTAAGPPTVRGLDLESRPCLGKDGQFGGTHSGGANASFADASVRFLRGDLDAQAWQAMVTLKGSSVGEE
jgi:prepilin-type processing-associated H-X9-DG protein